MVSLYYMFSACYLLAKVEQTILFTFKPRNSLGKRPKYALEISRPQLLYLFIIEVKRSKVDLGQRPKTIEVNHLWGVSVLIDGPQFFSVLLTLIEVVGFSNVDEYQSHQLELGQSLPRGTGEWQKIAQICDF